MLNSIMITNSVTNTDSIQFDIEQKLYESKYRASMGSIKSFTKSILFAVFAILLGMIADKLGIIQAFVLLQIFRVIPLFLYNKIFKKFEIS